MVSRQLAQIDSKDMGWSVWRGLVSALSEAMRDSAVESVVVTHGTDTLEETACLLHHLHDGAKPIVLTAAMRPATAADADGPRNLRDAVSVAREAALRGWGGAVAVLHGRVWSGRDVRKAHSHALDAFDGGGSAPLATLNPAGQMTASALAWPGGLAWGWAWPPEGEPPRVELLFSHADADGWLLDAALRQSTEDAASSDPARRAQALRGLVVAATGHGTLHTGLEAALQRAAAAGVRIWRSSRVACGGVTPREDDLWPAAGTLTPAQTRVALQLALWREGLSDRR